MHAQAFCIGATQGLRFRLEFRSIIVRDKAEIPLAGNGVQLRRMIKLDGTEYNQIMDNILVCKVLNYSRTEVKQTRERKIWDTRRTGQELQSYLENLESLAY
jgi:hypothetical protein